MKIDELLKRLESVKINENEKREIAEYLARKFSVNKSIYIHRIMTKCKNIYDINSYGNLFKSGGISPNDAYVFIDHHYSIRHDTTRYLYPFLEGTYLLLYAYLSKLKLGVDFYRVVPATGLKYVAMVSRLWRGKQRIVVEVADIDTAAINANLPRIVRDLSTKQIDDDVINEAISQLSSQKLFAGYDFYDASDIINRYYTSHEISLAKEVGAIKDAYNYIFQPYRIEYDLDTKQFVVYSGLQEKAF